LQRIQMRLEEHGWQPVDNARQLTIALMDEWGSVPRADGIREGSVGLELEEIEA
jgi:hypothetical protein